MGECFVCLEPCRHRFCQICKCYSHPKCIGNYLEEKCPVCKTPRITKKYNTRFRNKKLEILKPVKSLIGKRDISHEEYFQGVAIFQSIDANFVYKNKTLVKRLIEFAAIPIKCLEPCCESNHALILFAQEVIPIIMAKHGVTEYSC